MFRSSPESSLRTTPSRITSTRSHKPKSSSSSLLWSRIATPLAQVGEYLVELSLGAHVDPLRRVVEQEHLRVPHQPFAEDHLLRVAAAQRAHRVIQRAHLEPQVLRYILGVVPRPAHVQECPVARPGGQEEILQYGAYRQEALAAPVAGDESEALPHRLPGVREADVLAREPDGPRVRDGPEKGEQEVRLPLSLQTTEAQDLASPSCKLTPSSTDERRSSVSSSTSRRRFPRVSRRVVERRRPRS